MKSEAEMLNTEEVMQDDQFGYVAKFMYDLIVLKDPYLTYHYFPFKEHRVKKDTFIYNYLAITGIISMKLIIEKKIRQCIDNNTLNISYDLKDSLQLITATNNFSIPALKRVDYVLNKFLTMYFINKIDNSVDSELYKGIRAYTNPLDFLYYALPMDDYIIDKFNESSEGGYLLFSSAVNVLLFTNLKRIMKDGDFQLLIFILVEFSTDLLEKFINKKTGAIIKTSIDNPVFGLFYGLFFAIKNLYHDNSLNFDLLSTSNKLKDSNGFDIKYRQNRVQLFLTTIAKISYMRQEERVKYENIKVASKKGNVVSMLDISFNNMAKKNFEEHQNMIKDISTRLFKVTA